MLMEYLQNAPQDNNWEIEQRTLISHVNDMPVNSKKEKIIWSRAKAIKGHICTDKINSEIFLGKFISIWLFLAT